MFFVFYSGNPQDGEASGGLGDLRHVAKNLDDATEFAGVNFKTSIEDVEILDGQTGEIWFKLVGNIKWQVKDASR